MSKDLVVFKHDEVHGVLVIRKGQPQVVEKDDLPTVLGNLSPSDVFDFVQLQPDVSILVIGDGRLSEEQMQEIFGDEARFLRTEELPAKASSWKLPMAIPAMLERAVKGGNAELSDALRHAGAYLESHTTHKEMSPWQKGLVAASIRAIWDEIKKEGLAEGESHWGWLRSYMMGNGGPDEWEKEQGKLESYMRATDVMVRNVENRKWISKLTLAQILSVPITKVVRCCGAISDGLFDFSDELKKALFHSGISNNEINHLISMARGHEDEIPMRKVNEETGEIIYVKPSTGEEVENPNEPVLDQFLPQIESDMSVSASPKFERPIWTFDPARKMFGHRYQGNWTPGLSMVSEDPITKRFVDMIIAKCGVRADYDSEERGN